MRIRSSSWLVGILALCAGLPDPARAASFGTSALVAIEAATESQESTDRLPAGTAASLADGAASAVATASLATSQAAVTSTAAASASAASSWTDTLTLTGATGSARLEIRLRLHGTLDAGDTPGGWADVAYRAFAGLPGTDGALAPSILLAASAWSAFDSCESEAPPCGDPAQAIDDVLVLEAFVPYDVPFRLGVLLEVNARNGGRATFADDAFLPSIVLPVGASLITTSGTAYAITPEPSTLLLVAAGTALLSNKRKPKTPP